MLRFALRRILQFIPTILAITLIFAIVSMACAIAYYYKYLRRHRDLFSHYFNDYNRNRLRSIAQSECPERQA